MLLTRCSSKPMWLGQGAPLCAMKRSLVLFDRGDEVTVQAGGAGIRYRLRGVALSS